MKKYLALAIAVCLLICSVALADSEQVIGGSQQAETDVHFTMEQSEGFMVMIPASIELGSRIDSGFCVRLQVSDDFNADFSCIDVSVDENDYYEEWSWEDEEGNECWDRGYDMVGDQASVKFWLINHNNNDRQIWPGIGDDSQYKARRFDDGNLRVNDDMQLGYDSTILHWNYWNGNHHDDFYMDANIGIQVKCYSNIPAGNYNGVITFGIHLHEMDDWNLFTEGCVRVVEGDEAHIVVGNCSEAEDIRNMVITLDNGDRYGWDSENWQLVKLAAEGEGDGE